MPQPNKRSIDSHNHENSFLCAEYRALPSSLDAEALTVDVEYTTGAKVLRYDWGRGQYYFEELGTDVGEVRLDVLNNGAPVLDNHNRSSIDNILGTVIKADERTATLRFSKTARSKEAFEKIKDGLIQKVSVGYRIFSMEKTGEEDGKAIFRVTDWEPFEISLVAVPADDQAGFRAKTELGSCAGTYLHHDAKGETNTREKGYIMPQSVNKNNQGPVQPQVRNENEGLVPVSVENVDMEQLRREAIEEERARVTEIRSLASRMNLDDEFTRMMIEKGCAMDEVRKMALEQLAAESEKTHTRSQIQIGTDHSRENLLSGACDYMIYRAMPDHQLPENARHFAAQGYSLMDLAREFVSDRTVKGSREIAIRSMHTGSDLPNVLLNAMNKMATSQFAASRERTHTFWARKRTANDFKDLYHITADGDFKLEKVNEHGEYKSATIVDSKEKYRVQKYGKKINFSFEMIVNDDLSVLSDIIPGFVAGCIETELDVVYGLLVNNPALSDGVAAFHANHNNLIANAFSIAGLDAMSLQMKKQKTLSGKKLSCPMDVIIYGDENDNLVDRILTTEYNPTTVDSVNPYGPKGRRRITAVYEPKISEISATAWFAVTNNPLAKHVSYATLTGYDNPTITKTISQDPDGVSYVARHFIGAGFEDFRGIYKSTGQG